MGVLNKCGGCQMKQLIQKYFALPIFSLFVLLFFGEITVRYIGSEDIDGNFVIGSVTIRPYSLPVRTVQKNIDQFLSNKEESQVEYDPLLGWTNAPGCVSKDGLYIHNAQGIRVPESKREYSYEHSKDTFRIVFIGDSFTHGNEVVFEKSWPYLIEKKLNRAGLVAQIINLGVGGYGMDQAYLRWKTLGKKFQADLVVFGLQMENVRRNVNIIRPVYFPAANLAFSKPRFILTDDSLELINVPPIAPNEIPNLLANFEKWPLSSHEYFYKRDDYKPRWYLKSKFIALIRELLFPDRSLNLRPPLGIRSGIYPLVEEPAKVTLKIIDVLQKETAKDSSDLLLVHLPHIWGLGYYRKYGTVPYLDLLDEINRNFKMVDTKEAFMSRSKKYKNDDFYLSFHYSELGNEIVADTLAKFIIQNYIK